MSKAGRRRREERTRRRRQRWALVSSLLLVAAGALAYLGWTYGWGGVAAVNQPASAFVLEASDGRQVSLADYLGRKPVLLVFYMTYG